MLIPATFQPAPMRPAAEARRRATRVALEPLDGSPVWRAACLVPRGCTSTYGCLARLLGHGWCPQTVGQALKRNPHAPEVPCHRIVRADGTLGGYFGGAGADDPRVRTKVRLLREEGVRLQAAGAAPPRVHASCMWRFPPGADWRAVRLPGERSSGA
ncbi:unnamed protein product [Prorocentrum cordatum]|uniref:Methylated-DNA--protein-cysteine methyltransferase n=2 Tax=Prorocentrum cordatum TaxID=2364126 RepID=A0ABN9VWV7_9DINO|nr:unnamed protein product [Polarella glacialis]